jgi:hypothetical protein
MSASASSGGQAGAGAGEPASEGGGAYRPLLALVACCRCGAAVADSPDARGAHDRYHEGLRELWVRAAAGAAPPPPPGGARRQVDPGRRPGRW